MICLFWLGLTLDRAKVTPAFSTPATRRVTLGPGIYLICQSGPGYPVLTGETVTVSNGATPLQLAYERNGDNCPDTDAVSALAFAVTKTGAYTVTVQATSKRQIPPYVSVERAMPQDAWVWLAAPTLSGSVAIGLFLSLIVVLITDHDRRESVTARR